MQGKLEQVKYLKITLHRPQTFRIESRLRSPASEHREKFPVLLKIISFVYIIQTDIAIIQKGVLSHSNWGGLLPCFLFYFHYFLSFSETTICGRRTHKIIKVVVEQKGSVKNGKNISQLLTKNQKNNNENIRPAIESIFFSKINLSSISFIFMNQLNFVSKEDLRIQ